MNTFIIVLVLAIISTAIIYFALKTAKEVDETVVLPKFEPRRVTVVVSEGTEKPKRRYKKRNKKKKPTVAQNAQVEKRPVGRPKKSE